MTEKSYSHTLNDTIIEKVQSILNNTDCIEDIRITIEGNNVELPTIRYNIKEVIVPPDISNNKEVKND